MWSCSTPKQFILCAKQAKDAIYQWGLKETYNKFVRTKNKYVRKLEKVKSSLGISEGNIEDSVKAKVVIRAMEAHVQSI